MKKWMYLVSGIFLGAVGTLTGSVFADQLKSLVGKKVTAEYNVIINGKQIQAKGAVIDGQTNIPVRPIANAMGADIQVTGKTIVMNTVAGDKKGAQSPSVEANIPPVDDEDEINFLNRQKKDREEYLDSWKKDRERAVKLLDDTKKWAANKENTSPEENGILAMEKGLTQLDGYIAECEEKLRKINEELEAKTKSKNQAKK